MVTIELIPEDITELRFAFSPMWELVMSYRVLRNPARHALFLPWVEKARAALEGQSLLYLDAVVGAKGYFPDYLTPTPTSPLPSFDEELTRLRLTPPDEVRRDALRTFGASNSELAPAHRCYLEQPAQALGKLVDDLKVYWEAALAHDWPGIKKRLEGDVLRRAQQLALEGSSKLLSDLHPLLTVEKSTLKIQREHDKRVRPAGLGILLVPIFFSWPDLYYLAEPRQRPLIGYSPNGTALWVGSLGGVDKSLEVALGVSRAKVLSALQIPKTPSILAEDIGVSVGAISQQLARLRKAGLVYAYRSGRNTFYEVTPRGLALLGLFRQQS